MEGQDQSVLRRRGLRATERAWPILHWWPVEPRLGIVGDLRAHNQLVSAASPWLRGSDQPGLLATQPLRLLPDPDVFIEPARETGRIPFAGSLVQSLSGLFRHVDGRP